MANKKNISSGATKVEKLAKTQSTKSKSSEKEELENLADNREGVTKNSTKVKPQKGHATKQKAKSAGKAKRASAKRLSKEERKKQAEEKRLLRIKKRAEHKLARKKLAAEKKQKRLERRLAHKEKIQERKAELKRKRAEAKEEKQKRRDNLKHESKEKRAKRIAEERKAKRLAAKERREKRIEERREKREQRQKNRESKRTHKQRQRAPGFGGWLAAVISLGVTTLALGTILTFGWMNMGDMQASIAGGYTQSLYELNAIVDDLDTNLARAKASSSVSDRVKVFTDIAVESNNAELILERFPLEMQTTERLTSFINDMGSSAKGMLFTVANGGELSAKQLKELENMYNTNAKVKSEINKLIERTCEKDMLAAMRGDDCALIEGFTQIQNNVFEENVPQSGKLKTPAFLEGEEEIPASRAETIAKNLFGDYKVSDAKCVGEAMGIIPLYNVNLTVPDGEMLVQITKNGGKVVGFDSYKDCKDNNFSVDRCVGIAQDFLTKMGYNGVKAVWASENGTTCNLHFATEAEGKVIYSDLIKVKVCEERGIVTGMDASGYVLRHDENRTVGSASISEEQAKSVINGNIAVSSTRLVVIPENGQDVLCYEFFGEMDGVEYYVYVDAQTGEELEVKTVVGTAQGKLIK